MDFSNIPPVLDACCGGRMFWFDRKARHFEQGWIGLKYGTLKGDWREELRRGFAECFRVLRPDGVLIFKWCEDEIPVSQILALTPERPLFGHRSGKQQKTHWVAFMKHNASSATK